MTQLEITAKDNKNLFSNYYLDNLIKNNPEWKKEEHKAAFFEIIKLYETEKDYIPNLNEKQLEQRFFASIFRILNHTVEVNEGTDQGEFPDYAFFPDRASLNDSHKMMGNSFYKNAIAIGEVKRWGIELDRFGKDEKDRKRNPSLQIWIYLHDVSPKWGILSNGAKWRLYCKDGKRLRDNYYEIDLPMLIVTNDIENFKYFYYFFRRDAFLPSIDGKIFLDEVLKGSEDYAKEIGDDLKDNVYKAMKKVAEGFFSWSKNGLELQSEEARKNVQKCTMLLLYRSKEIIGATATEEYGWNYIRQNYPKIVEHLEPYMERAKARYDQGDFWWELRACDYYSLFENEKIVWPNLQDSNKFSYDNEGFYINAPAVILPTNNKALLCLINSKLAWYFFKDICVIRSGGFIEMKPQYFEQFPVKMPSSVTPPDRRATLLEQAKALYSEFLGAPGADNLDRMDRKSASNPVNPVHPVQTALTTAPDSQKILDFVKARLLALPEESEVVHDLLAFLAERMIEMNKEKNTEIKGFMRWLEGEIGEQIEVLTNKTAIKEYYKAGFDAFAGVLAKNKKKLKEGYDPTKREPKEKLQAEFNASVGKLAPLLKKIQATDELIDVIVYNLYGLTSDEIKIVEESI